MTPEGAVTATSTLAPLTGMAALGAPLAVACPFTVIVASGWFAVGVNLTWVALGEISIV